MRTRERGIRTSALVLVWLVAGLVAVTPRPASAQADSSRADSARVSYLTTEIVFFTAGRVEGVRVGDTVRVAPDTGGVITRAVVVSAALHTASARLLASAAPIAVGQVVRYAAHPAPPPAAADTAAQAAAPARAWVQALVPAADSAARRAGDTALATDTSAVRAAPAPPPRVPLRQARPLTRRLAGGLQFEQLASSAGGASALTSYQSVASLALTAPLGTGLELRTRITSRWRAGASATSTGMSALVTIPYELELRIAPPGSRWNASLGRFVPLDAIGIGYLDGARVEVAVAEQQRFGVVAGFVPNPSTLAPATGTTRAGAYWAFGGNGDLSGSLSAAADWANGARRRTVVATQAYWRIAGPVFLSEYTEMDVAAPWQGYHGARLTTAYANLRADLPLGFRSSVGVETHQAVLLWESVLLGDTVQPQGRLDGVSFSLGHDVAGFRVDLSGGALKRTGDPTASIRGMLMISRGALFVTATGQHGDLFDYGAFVARVMLPYRALPFNAALGASASFTRSAGGAVTQWRYSLQPEVSRSLGGGLFASLGGDFGLYAGRTSTYLHAGVSYRFR